MLVILNPFSEKIPFDIGIFYLKLLKIFGFDKVFKQKVTKMKSVFQSFQIHLVYIKCSQIVVYAHIFKVVDNQRFHALLKNILYIISFYFVLFLNHELLHFFRNQAETVKNVVQKIYIANFTSSPKNATQYIR
jgi:hypothetical protein